MTMIRATKGADSDLKLASLVVALREIAAQFEALGSAESVPPARALALSAIGMQLRKVAHEALQIPSLGGTGWAGHRAGEVVAGLGFACEQAPPAPGLWPGEPRQVT